MERPARKLTRNVLSVHRREVLQTQNARLNLENQVLRHKMLDRKLRDERREMESMRQLADLQREVAKATDGLAASFNSEAGKDEGEDEDEEDEEGMHLRGLATTDLIGDYIARCREGHGCEKFYRPENLTHYEESNHTIVVTSNGIGWPLGPTERVPTTSFMKSVHDIIPKEGRVPHADRASAASIGSHWMTMGALDNFVPFNSTRLNSKQYRLLPPWTRHMLEKKWGMSHEEKTEEEEDKEVEGLEHVNASDVHGNCPGDPSGASCLSGSTGVEGVHEWTLFKHGKSWNTRQLEKKGINVGEWGIPGLERHRWNRAGADDPPPGGKEDEIDWTQLKKPQWSWENSAMKSQGWDPEGVMNRQLVLGGGFGPGNVSLTDVLDDNYVNETGYAGQVQVVSDVEHPHNDHFADWEPKSGKNVKLLYGESALTNDMRWSIKNKSWVPTRWGWGDDKVPSQEAAAKQNGLELPRTGEPFGDFMGGGWSGANGVASNSYDVAKVEKTTDAYPEKTKLHNLGVNTDGFFDK